MNGVELSKQFFVELIKLFVSGILGGVVVSVINYRLLRAQKRLDARYELQRKKLDALRDIDFMLNWLYKFIFPVKKRPSVKSRETDEFTIDLINKVHSWETLFLDDQEISMALQKIEIFIDPSRNTFLQEKQTSQKSLIIAFNEIRMTVRNKIIEIQNL
jgi:hypothetical protein